MPVSVAYLGVTQGDTWPATEISASVDIGSADATRQIVAVVTMQDDGCYATGGTFAGEVAGVDHVSSTTVGRQISIVRAAVPSGSGAQTLSIDVTPYTGNFIVHWYSVLDASETLVGAGSVVPAEGNSYTLAIDGETDGAVIAALTRIDNAVGTLVLLDFDSNQAHTQAFTAFHSGHDAVASTGSKNITTDATPNNPVYLAAISFAPLAAGGSVGSADGQAIAAATGAADAAAAGEVAGVGAAAGAGSSDAAGAGSSAGSASVSAAGEADAAAAGSSAGAGAASGAGASDAGAAGAAGGLAAAAAAGASVAEAAGLAEGSSSASASAGDGTSATGTATGQASAAGIGAAAAAGTGTAAGTSSAAAVSASVVPAPPPSRRTRHEPSQARLSLQSAARRLTHEPSQARSSIN